MIPEVMGASDTGNGPSADRSQVRCLVVDDHAAVREGVKMILTRDREISVIGESGSGDGAIDRLHKENQVLAFGTPGESRAVSAQVVELMFMSKGYERAGDHAKNIAEQVIFLSSGEDVKHTQNRG